MTPDDVLADLKEGNRRFVDGKTTSRDWGAQVHATASGQYPKAIILGCLDSRVPPEIIFDQGIGDLFVGRVAGNVEDETMLGSFEFGTKVAGSKVVVVLGHTSCGAVKGAVDQVKLGNLTGLLAEIEPAVAAGQKRIDGPRESSNAALVQAAVEENVRRTVGDLLERSDVLAEMVQSGEIAVVGAIYELDTGRVTWLEE
jgi:carbonic anhydrase